MGLVEQINADIKTAMKAKEREKLEALRAVKAALLLAQTSEGSTGEISEEESMKMLQKLVKQRKDSAKLYQEQGRDDLADPEIFQAEVIEAYLPAQMSEEDIKAGIQELIQVLGASSMADMGKVMGAATKKFAGKADNKVVSVLVKQLLA